MKKIFNLILIVLFSLTGCGKSNTVDLEKNISNLDLNGDLIVQKVYYHNVAEYKKEKDEGLFHLFDKDTKLWIEYTGTVDLGIDLTKVKIDVRGNKINVFIPKTKITAPVIKNQGKDSFKIYNSKDGLLNKNNLTLSDTTRAVKKAQKEMVNTVENDTQLLRSAQLKSKNLIEERISVLSDMDESKYKINWSYEEN